MRELFNLEAEKSIIGELLRGGNDTPFILATLKPENFYDAKNEIIFRIISELSQDGNKIDLVTVSEKLEKEKKLDTIGGNSYLASAVQFNLENFGAKAHTKIVRELFTARKSWEALAGGAHKIKDGKYEKIENILSETFNEVVKVSSQNAEEKIGIQDIINEFTKVQDEYVKLKESGQELLGIPTGYKSIDRAIDGYRPEHLWTIAAQSSVGKTSFTINLIKSLLMAQNRRVVLFSLEMSKTDLLAKLIAIQAQVSPLATIKNASDPEIAEKSLNAMGELHSRRLTIYSEVDDIDEIILLMQFEMLKDPVDVFFIDYLQNITSASAKDEYHLITNAVKKIQTTTRKLKATTVLLYQVSNETKRATGCLDVDGKGSGAIKAASNFFMYLKREGLEDEIAKYFETGADIPLKCIINKNRHGKIGAFNLFLKQTTGEINEG
jgi:replicative DNA helicase